MRRSLIGILFSLCSSYALAASPIQAPPLSQALSKAAVQPVEPGTQVLVPIITWGGDIATLVANGNAMQTKQGSPFAREGLYVKLYREDVFAKQVESYLAGKSPYLRGTLGMVQQASDVLCKQESTCPKVIYQMTWSAGGDALVVGEGIRTVTDLKGKRIAVQAYGPHVDYLAKVLADAGLSLKDVTLVWMRDLTGTQETPVQALIEKKADAATVIIPDAQALTSGGNIGTGAEGSVKGAKILLSTRTANRIIADVYAVRSDYLAANADSVQKFVHGLMVGQEELRTIVGTKNAKYQETFKSAAQALLDSADAVPDAEGLYGDAEFVGYDGNVGFFARSTEPRRFDVLNSETREAFSTMGLVAGGSKLAAASLSYDALQKGLTNAGAKPETKFNANAVASVVTRRQQQGSLADGELFSFTIYFEPNQNGFSPELYAKDFERVTQLAATYGGAIITVEGHSDPMGWLKKKKAGETPVVLNEVKQAARNLSLARSAAVRDSVIAYAQGKSVALDKDQFALVPMGINKPASGICGEDPCAPKNEKEWRSNMRVEFRIIQVEAEQSVFQPL